MAEFTVNVTEDNTDKVIQEKDNAIMRALEAIGLQAEGYAKLNLYPGHGLDTGRLRNSITHVPEGTNAEIVGTNVEYAPYVEYGTSRARARPYLKPAVTDHIEEYRRIVESILSGG